MKKLSMILISSILAATLYFATSHLLHKKAQPSADYLNIALFTPTTHPALEEIERGFKETLQNSTPKTYAFTTFNANGNRTLLRAQAEEMVDGNYDLLFTIGATCSQTIAELLKKKGITTPHVFGGVDGPEFAHALATSNEFSTGVYVHSNYKHEMEIIHALKPGIKNILLVYDPTHGIGLEKDRKEIATYCKKFGTRLHAVEIYQTNEIQQKVAALLPHMDVVLVLTDNTVVAGIDVLIVLCNRYGVTLLASDLESGKKGAALAYGITEYESGSGAAQKAHEILIAGKKSHEVSLDAITNFRVELNKKTMEPQNLKISDELVQQCIKEHTC